MGEVSRRGPSWLRQFIELPPVEGSTTLDLGCRQLVVERRRGAILVWWHDGSGRVERTLGLPNQPGRLELWLRPPPHPLHVQLSCPVWLVSGGRVHGYLQLPAAYELAWTDAKARNPVALQTLTAVRGMKLAWSDDPAGGHYRMHCESRLHEAPVGPHGDLTWIWTPVRLSYRGPDVLTVQTITIELEVGELWRRRGHLLAMPRRFRFGGAGQVDTETRWFAKHQAWAPRSVPQPRVG
jgi:hypothetical protein